MAHTSLAPLYERRPEWVRQRIDRQFASEHDDLPPLSMSGAFGTNLTYNFGNTTNRELAQHLRSQFGRPLHVLDVGTGVGIPVAVHRDEGDNAQGITAFDYRRLNPQHVFTNNSEAYIVGNAEHMYALGGLRAWYDLVMSQRTMHHLIDPLGAFEQMANRVGAGGLLCVDDFEFSDRASECTVTALHVRDAMAEGGFELAEGVELSEAALTRSALPTALWMRSGGSQAPIRLPVTYALGSDEALIYHSI